MNRLRDKDFNKVVNHLNQQSCIDWIDNYCELNECFKDNVSYTTEDLIISFDYIIKEEGKVHVVPINIYNNDKGFDYDLSDFQFIELEKIVKTLFNFDN